MNPKPTNPPRNVSTTASAPRTADLLLSRGLNVRPIEISELQKAEAGLTCLSLLYQEGAVDR